jgi:hypothetical protein
MRPRARPRPSRSGQPPPCPPLPEFEDGAGFFVSSTPISTYRGPLAGFSREGSHEGPDGQRLGLGPGAVGEQGSEGGQGGSDLGRQVHGGRSPRTMARVSPSIVAHDPRGPASRESWRRENTSKVVRTSAGWRRGPKRRRATSWRLGSWLSSSSTCGECQHDLDSIEWADAIAGKASECSHRLKAGASV